MEETGRTRRKLLQVLAFAGAGSMGTLGARKLLEKRTVRFRVKGFSCPTCAVGMDTLLMQQRGVLWAKSTYPQGEVTIEFHPHLVGEEALKQCIADAGFQVV